MFSELSPEQQAIRPKSKSKSWFPKLYAEYEQFLRNKCTPTGRILQEEAEHYAHVKDPPT